MNPDPQVITDGQAMSVWADDVRSRGQRIGLIPTMGYLHEGHLALIDEARRHVDQVVVSIFVNPTQFGPKEDLARYPRDLSGDLRKIADRKAKIAFVPEPGEMYQPGHQTYVDVRGVSQGLCGGSRPGHFVGVATVVLKLFNIVRPHVSVFGEKDYQQLSVIRAMVADLNVPVKVLSLPTVREADGLALSSRNVYLLPDQRTRASALSQTIVAVRAQVAQGERRVDVLLVQASQLLSVAVDRLDYVEIRDAVTLLPLSLLDRPAVILVAAFFGSTRLIDNGRLDG